MNSIITIPVHGPNLQESWEQKNPDFTVGLGKEPGDGPSVRRLLIEAGEARLVLLPSKGLTLLSCSFSGTELFWEPPLEKIPDPEEIDLAGDLLINGKPQAGARWIATFLGGVELMGLDNWGMFGRGEKGELLTLHGNASNIPVYTAELSQTGTGDIICTGSFTVYGSCDTVKTGGEARETWRVARRVTLSPARRGVEIQDTITNLSAEPRFPDWGYHIQLRPEPGCRLLIPSGKVRPRFGDVPEAGFETWRPAVDESVREERGYIHQNLLARDGRVDTLLLYPDGAGIRASIPHAPYTMAWNSAGGARGREFLLPERPEEPLIPSSWNGVGPEIGASALDHDGDTDPQVTEEILAPGAHRTLTLSFALLTSGEAERLEGEISGYSLKRKE